MKIYKQDSSFFMEDNGTTTQLVPDKGYYLRLPANSTNRQFVSCKKVDNAPNQTIDYGDEIKQPRTIGPVTKKPLEDYLNDEDKALYLSLIEKAKKAREEASKKQPMTELEKAQRAYEKALARYNKLMGLDDEQEVNE